MADHLSGTMLLVITGVGFLIHVYAAEYMAHDAGYYWPRRGLYKRPGTIRVVIGPPIAAAGRDPREVNEEVQAWIEAHSRH